MVNLGWIKVKDCPRCGSNNIDLNKPIRVEGDVVECCFCKDCKTLVGVWDSAESGYLRYWNNIRRNSDHNERGEQK